MKLQSRDAKEKVSLEWRLQGDGESGVASPGRRWVWSDVSREKVSLEWRLQGEGESGVAPRGAEHRPSVLRRLHRHYHHVDLRHINHRLPVLGREAARRQTITTTANHAPQCLFLNVFCRNHVDKRIVWRNQTHSIAAIAIDNNKVYSSYTADSTNDLMLT